MVEPAGIGANPLAALLIVVTGCFFSYRALRSPAAGIALGVFFAFLPPQGFFSFLDGRPWNVYAAAFFFVLAGFRHLGVLNARWLWVWPLLGLIFLDAVLRGDPVASLRILIPLTSLPFLAAATRVLGARALLVVAWSTALAVGSSVLLGVVFAGSPLGAFGDAGLSRLTGVSGWQLMGIAGLTLLAVTVVPSNSDIEGVFGTPTRFFLGGLGAVILTASGSRTFIAVAALVVVLALVRKREFRLLVTALAFGLLVLATPVARTRLFTTGSGSGLVDPGRQRVVEYVQTFYIDGGSFWGRGVGATYEVFRDDLFDTGAGDVHNEYVRLAAEIGYPLTALLVASVVVLSVRQWQQGSWAVGITAGALVVAAYENLLTTASAYLIPWVVLTFAQEGRRSDAPLVEALPAIENPVDSQPEELQEHQFGALTAPIDGDGSTVPPVAEVELIPDDGQPISR